MTLLRPRLLLRQKHSAERQYSRSLARLLWVPKQRIQVPPAVYKRHKTILVPAKVAQQVANVWTSQEFRSHSVLLRQQKKQTAGQWMGTLNKRLEAFRIAKKLIDWGRQNWRLQTYSWPKYNCLLVPHSDFKFYLSTELVCFEKWPAACREAGQVTASLAF